MPSSGLIVLAPVKPGCEETLRTTLNRIGNDIKGKRLARTRALEPHIDLPRSRTTHFARLALLADPAHGPDRQRLLLVTDYDGPWQAHVAELLELTTMPEAIWGCCTGYSGPECFAGFLRSHTVEPQAYYRAFPAVTLAQIRQAVKVQAQADAPPIGPPPGSTLAALTGMVSDLLRLPAAALDLPGLLWRHGPLHALLAARRVNATLDRVWWVWLFNRLTLNGYPPPRHRYSSVPVDTAADCAPATDEDEVVSYAAWAGTPGEDNVSQNQLTLVTVVRPEQLARLQAVLAVIDLYAQRLAGQGSLVGIGTIHTVRWALLDGGQRLLLASNYDGAWESYIDEFAELILSGLDAIWEGSHGFPELGAQDVVALKHFLRCHQAPANVFYSAYPAATVLNIADGLKLAQQAAPQVLATTPVEANQPS
jgi:hypothetical protein